MPNRLGGFFHLAWPSAGSLSGLLLHQPFFERVGERIALSHIGSALIFRTDDDVPDLDNWPFTIITCHGLRGLAPIGGSEQAVHQVSGDQERGTHPMN